MTRDDITKEYTIENGVIRTPGKFEGEMLYVPYFWDSALLGESDLDTGCAFFFVIDELDRAQFAELGTAYGIMLAESENGFVYACVYDSKEEYEKHVICCEQEDDEEDEEEQ